MCGQVRLDKALREIEILDNNITQGGYLMMENRRKDSENSVSLRKVLG